MQTQLHNIEITKNYFQRKIQKTKNVIKKIKQMNDHINYQTIEKINKVTSVSVNIKHTSQFTIHLGCQYYVQVKTNQAIQILERKIKNYDLEIKKANNNQKQINQHKQKSKQKQSIKQIGNATLTVIGEEDGQQIINIVEIDQNLIQKTSQPQIKNTQKTVEREIQTNQNFSSKKEKTGQFVKIIQKPETKQAEKDLNIQDDFSQDILQNYNKKKQAKLTEQIQKEQAQNIKIQVTKQKQQSKNKKVSKFKAERMKNRQ